MPLASSCSAAISAACHPPKEDIDPSTKRVMWGVAVADEDLSAPEQVGHCSFTSLEVQAPTVGRLYAGQ